MTIFDRYVLRTIAFTTLITLIFLLGIDFLIQSASKLDDLGRGNYSISIMFLVLFLKLPHNALLFMPAAVLVGAMMGLGQLSSQNELTVAQVSGCSPLRATRIGLAWAFGLGCLMILVGETIAPKWQARSDLLYNQALGRASSVKYAQGIWLKDNEGIVHIGTINPDGSIANLRFFNPENNIITITTSERATFQTDKWHLENTQRILIDPEKISRLNPPSHWDNHVTPKTLHFLASTKNTNTIVQLLTLIKFLDANQLDHRQESLNLWQKILQPLSTTTMLLLALPFVFNQTRSTQQGTRLVIGILLGVSYYVAAGIVANFALLFGWPPFFGAILPMLLFSIFPLVWLIKR